MWHEGSNYLTRDQTQAPCIENMESYPLDHQGIPKPVLVSVKSQTLLSMPTTSYTWKGDHAYQSFVLNISPSLLQIAVDSVLPEPTTTPFSLRSLLQEREDSSELDKIQRAPFPVSNSVCLTSHMPGFHTQMQVCCAVLSCFSHVQIFATLSTITLQAPLERGILQARILEWVAMPFCRGSS